MPAAAGPEGVSRPRLLVVVASTRPARLGASVASWFVACAQAHGAFDVAVADLADPALPMMDEPRHPRLGTYEHEHTRHWSADVDAADAFAFVMPEYNGGYPAPLKNAIDYLHREWAYKPAGLVSYGGASAGLRAATALRPVLSILKVVPIPEAVAIGSISQRLDDARRLEADGALDRAAARMLDELVRWATALASLRAA